HGRCSGQSAAAADRIFRAERRFTRSRYADRLRRHEWSSGHHLEALVPSAGERMSRPMIIEGTIPLRRHRRTAGPDGHNSGSLATNSLPPSRIPRIARLMALARHVDELVRSGTVCSYAVAARVGRISRARMSQIMNLLNLAPDLQEQLLFLRQPARGRAAPVLRQVLTVATTLEWDEQRRRWRKLQRATRRVDARRREHDPLPRRSKSSRFHRELPG